MIALMIVLAVVVAPSFLAVVSRNIVYGVYGPKQTSQTRTIPCTAAPVSGTP